MASRPVFYVNEKNDFCQKNVNFKWNPGFAEVQLQKNIAAIHSSFLKEYSNLKILEVSSAATDYVAIKASAFNISVQTTRGLFTVEQAFQAGKVFKNAGVQNYLLKYSSLDAKKVISSINEKDQLVAFEEFGNKFPLEPKTYFYNWIYLKALNQKQNKLIRNKILQYDAFTDIYFNPKKSFSCQAQACSIYVSLYRKNKLKEALSSKKKFLQIVYGI